MSYFNLETKSDEANARIADAESKADAATNLVELKKALDKRDSEIKSTLKKLADDVATKGNQADYEASAKKLDELGSKASDIATQMQALEQKLARPIGGNIVQGKSLGQTIVEDQAMKDFIEGKTSKATMNVKSFERKSITSAEDSAGALVVPERLGLISPPEQALLIRDLFMPGTTSTNALEYPQEKFFDNKAEPQKGELQVKSQSDIGFEMVSTTVKTLAHYMYASKQIMDDAPQLASYINGRLIYGLKLVEEEQLLLGDGTGQNLFGIMPQSTEYDATLEAKLDIKSKNKMDVLRVAMLQVQLALYPASAMVLHPIDWASITLTKDANGNYMIANPQSTVSQMLWSNAVIPSMSMPEDNFLVGAFNLGAQVFDREQANIAISYEDRDNFIKNAVTIRAEERLALAVYRPESFVKGKFSTGTGE